MGKWELSFLSDNMEANHKNRPTGKAIFLNLPDICVHLIFRGHYVYNWNSHGKKVQVKQSTAPTTNKSSPPEIFQVWMPLQNYSQLKPMGQASVLLHQTATGGVIPWWQGQGRFLQLKAILRQGHSCKLPTINIPKAGRMNILALKCVSNITHQSISCAHSREEYNEMQRASYWCVFMCCCS